jgi:hypothetical protein
MSENLFEMYDGEPQGATSQRGSGGASKYNAFREHLAANSGQWYKLPHSEFPKRTGAQSTCSQIRMSRAGWEGHQWLAKIVPSPTYADCYDVAVCHVAVGQPAAVAAEDGAPVKRVGRPRKPKAEATEAAA